MNSISRFLLLFCLASLMQACIVADQPYSSLPPGPWRAVLKLDEKPLIINEDGAPMAEKMVLNDFGFNLTELPLNFEVKYRDAKTPYLELHNAEERFKIEKIAIGRDFTRGKDTIYIDFPIYDSYIKGVFEENIIEGQWIIRSAPDRAIPFLAHHGRAYRFTTLRKAPTADLSGRWSVTFGTNADPADRYPAVGEFKQSGNQLTGTFLTETGDYRYLEGTVQANKAYLSTFDGRHAFLFEMKIKHPDTLVGSFRSGKSEPEIWIAYRNPKARLRNADSLTYLKPGYQRFDFAFPDETGKKMSLNDPSLLGKAKIIQIMGTWCPNCRDETSFLVDYLRQKPNAKLAVIALAFEPYEDPAKVQANLKRYRDYFKLPYPILWGGNSNKAKASAALPMLNQVLSFPTLIFLDANNQVQRIHTGFSGPATSEYKQFTTDFDRFVTELLAKTPVK